MDLEHIRAKGEAVWGELSGKRIFITGGTGFFGSWLLESLIHLNRALGLGASALVLTRNPAQFRASFPHLADDPAISMLEGDVKSFAFPKGRFDLIIHGATTNARETFAGETALNKFETLAFGTRRVLECAQISGAEKLLFTSSGVVYGEQPSELSHIPEDYDGAPLPGYSQWALAEGKRSAELLCGIVGESSGITLTIARCFSFVGPRLPLDIHYAIGNFIRDALAGGPIIVKGDGRPMRAYLYAADLAVWLWTILLKGSPGAIYNVGSEDAVSISELARIVASQSPVPLEVRVTGEASSIEPPSRYVPSTQKARTELGLQTWVDLKSAIQRTMAFHGHLREVAP